MRRHVAAARGSLSRVSKTAKLGLGQLAPLSWFETRNAKTRIESPMQATNGMTNGLTHTFHLMLAPFVQRQLE
jgi:hypothetical protein